MYDIRIGKDNLPLLHVVGETDIDGFTAYESPEMIADLIYHVFEAGQLFEEHVWMLSFDVQLHLNGIFELGHGTTAHCTLGVSQVARRALLSGATYVALAHNHPSGTVSPSSWDRKITADVKSALELLGIGLVDHVIVAGRNGQGFYSLRGEREGWHDGI